METHFLSCGNCFFLFNLFFNKWKPSLKLVETYYFGVNTLFPWKNKTRVTSYEFKSTSYEFKSTSYEFKSTSYEFKSTSYEFKFTSDQFRSTSYEFKFTSYQFKPTSYEFKFTSYQFKLTSYQFKSTSYEFKLTSYQFKSTSLRIIKSMKTELNNIQIFTRNQKIRSEVINFASQGNLKQAFV